jgi:hypothetical protein
MAESMTEQEAIETCGRAIAKNLGSGEDGWEMLGSVAERAKELVLRLRNERPATTAARHAEAIDPNNLATAN